MFDFQEGGAFFIEKNTETEVNLSPFLTKEVSFYYLGRKCTFVSRVNDVVFMSKKTLFRKSKHVFIRVLERGKLTLLVKYINNGSNPSSYQEPFTEKYLYFKNKLFEPRYRRSSWKSDMLTYFLDCPALQQKIRDKKFEREDALRIVDFYNTECS